VDKTAQAAVPRAHVEAGAHLREDCLERIEHGLEVALLESDLGAVFVCHVVDLFLEDGGLVEQIDEVVEAVGDSDDVGSERWALFVLDMLGLHQVLHLGVLRQHVVEDSLHDGDLALGV